MVVPSSRRRSGSSPLTLAFVPTGMNAGVGTSPCAVRRTPARAAPSVAVTAKLMVFSSPCLATFRAPSRNSPFVRSKAGGGTGWPLENQHGVSERVEPVALLDRDPIELPRLLHSGERHHEREQRGPRQVEVRDQRVHARELEPRRDEEARPPPERSSSRHPPEHPHGCPPPRHRLSGSARHRRAAP